VCNFPRDGVAVVFLRVLRATERKGTCLFPRYWAKSRSPLDWQIHAGVRAVTLSVDSKGDRQKASLPRRAADVH